jgi:uncharacterized protein YbjT (DUF2867 family)
MHPSKTSGSPAAFAGATALPRVAVRPHGAGFGAAHCTVPRRVSVTMVAPPLTVLVTGAAGRTGRLVLQRLCARPEDFKAPRGLVRDLNRAQEAVGEHCAGTLVEGNVLDKESLQKAMAGVDALVILTSAVPKMNPPVEGQPPAFHFEDDGTPEIVDWLGGKNQIDVAKEAKVRHVVLVGSMGATDLNHPLNRVGNGNILRFKRQAQVYLIESGLNYTIINPGGLQNEDCGEREVVVSRLDNLFKIYQPGPSIPRGDVAEVVVQALLSDNAYNKAFDVACKPKGEGHVISDFDALFAETAPGLD